MDKWQVQSDDYGNLYFYNSLTGESVWELPDEEVEDLSHEVDSTPYKAMTLEQPREQVTIYAIAVGVADVMAKLVESVETALTTSAIRRKFMSLAAEKRHLRNVAIDEKRKKRLRDRTVRTYVNALVSELEKQLECRKVGSVFTAQEAMRWQQERDDECRAKRRAVRRAQRHHRANVKSLQQHQHMLRQFRSDLMKFLLGELKCSTEVQKQRILLLTTPQILSELQKRKQDMARSLKPEIRDIMAAEETRSQQKYDKNIQKVFATIDEAGTGKLHLLQILFGVTSNERSQKYAIKVRGLQELLKSTELQRFLVDFVSHSSRIESRDSHLLTASEFREFVLIIEEVLVHCEGVKAAVEDAENDIEAILAMPVSVSSGSKSLVQKRMEVLSKKKTKHETAVLKEYKAQVDTVRHHENQGDFGLEDCSLVAPIEEWKMNHHHRWIRVEDALPVFCCLCRRRKWELWRSEQEERESKYRSSWPTIYALRVEDEELRFAQERDRRHVDVQPLDEVMLELQDSGTSINDDTQRTKYELAGFQESTNEVENIVQEVMVSLVMLVEATAFTDLSKQNKPQRRVHKKAALKSYSKRTKKLINAKVLERIREFEHEEKERKAMYTEELHMVIMLERNRRIIERPLLLAQDAAHDALTRLMQYCVKPSGFPSLDFAQSLSFVPPYKMTLAVTYDSVKLQSQSNRLVLQTIPCRTEKMADYVLQQGKNMQHKALQSPYVVDVSSVAKLTYQQFTDLGLLVECWPVVFVVLEYFDNGSWLVHYRSHFIDMDVNYAAVEQHLQKIFRQVASGLAAMHSRGLLHLNINLGNIYIASSSNESVHVKISGLLSWKHDFDADSLQFSRMHDCFNFNYAPPELFKEGFSITAKADSWMLGCALCEALFLWQHQQLVRSTPSRSSQPFQPIIFHSKPIQELLEKLPIATTFPMRSLIRMLLQPTPGQRPQMSQVVALLCTKDQLMMPQDHAQVATLKELFQAAQQDDFNAVHDYLEVLLHKDEESHAIATSPIAIEAIVEAKTKNSLLHYACDNGNLEACKVLLMCKGMVAAFLNELNTFGHTPLFYAASSGKLPVVKWLVSNGADIDTDPSERTDVFPRDGDFGTFTPLQIACYKGHEAVANFLIECNAQLSGTRRNGKTPLHFASAQNHAEIVKLLLEAGADVHAADAEGKTPVDVANSAILPLLLPDEYDVRNEERNNDEGEMNDNDDDDDEFEGNEETRHAMDGVKNAFGAKIARAFQSKQWKMRVDAITEASMCFQNVFKRKALVKAFDGACSMIEMALQDAVTQVASSCCTSLLKVAFGSIMSEKDFHTADFHENHPSIQRITSALLTRGAGSNEKDSSEAVTSLLFLIRKSADITRFLTLHIARTMIPSTTTAFELASNSTLDSTEPLVPSANASWRHQLVAIKILNAIANQYRLDEQSSAFGFANAMQTSMVALQNSSVHVRTASIDLLVQCLVIRCEDSEMRGTCDAIYEHTKNWCESLFKEQNQQLKPSIQAKINTGLKNSLQMSKRLSTRRDERSDGEQMGIASADSTAFDHSATMLAPQSKAFQRQDDLPYAEPIQEQKKELVEDLVACFGEKATRCLFSHAWAPRVEALSYVQYLIESRQLSFESHRSSSAISQRTLMNAIRTTLLQALQDRVNAVFEAAVSLLMEVSIAFDNAVTSPSDMTAMHDLVRPLIPRLLVKLGDSKNRLHVTAEDALLLLSRQTSCIGPVFLLEELIACDRNSSLQTLSGVYLTNKLALVSKLMLEYGIQESSADKKGLLPIRNVLQLALQVCEHKDQSVRLMSLQIVADTMQVARSAAMPFLDALARFSRQKLIQKLVERGVMESDMLMDEVDDFEVSADTARPGTSGSIRPPTASGSSTKHRPALANASLSVTTPCSAPQSSNVSQSQPVQLPYGTALTAEQRTEFSTIIQGFGENLVRCLLDKAWAQREAAIREVERQVLCCASGRIAADTALPKTLEALGMLAQVLEIGLNDTVARVFQCILRLFQVIATDFLPLVASEHHYVDGILENVVSLVLQKLGDTKQRLRQDCFTLLHSMASLGHIGHARMCKMLTEKYQQLASSSPAVAVSPLIIGELLRLLTMLVREAPTDGNHQQPNMSLILSLVRPALENKHVDVRNAAITTYIAIYEITNGGTKTSYGPVDLNTFLAGLKPSMRKTITHSVVQMSKALPINIESRELDKTSRPEIDSSREFPRSSRVDTHSLRQICPAEITELLTLSCKEPAQLCLGVSKFVDHLVNLSPDPTLKGSWETCCLLVKQLMLNAVPSVCLAAFDLFQIVIDPPSQNCSHEGHDYAIPWVEWGVHLILGSTVRSVVQQSGSDSVRVRSKVREILRLIAGKSGVGKNAVCNAILSAPEQSDLTASADQSIAGRKVAITKLRWQLSLRLELLYDFLIVSNRSDNKVRRKPSARGSNASSSSEPLGLENIVPFLGSSVTHPSPLVRKASIKIMRFLRSTCEEELTAFIHTSCSPALQRRLQPVMTHASRKEEDEGNNADHFDAHRTTCVRGSRASHVRRIAALRPPRSVPIEENEMMADVFPPPNSAPGSSRRGGEHQGDKDSMSAAPSTQQPIWLQHQPESSKKLDMFGAPLSFNDGEPQDPTMGTMVGSGAIGLMKARRKAVARDNNDARNERTRDRVY